MAVVSARCPIWHPARRPRRRLVRQRNFFGYIGRNNASPRRSSSLCTECSEPATNTRPLAAIAIRRIVVAVQRHLAAGGNGGKAAVPLALSVPTARSRRGGFRGRLRGEGCVHRSRRRHGLRPAARARNRRRWRVRWMPAPEMRRRMPGAPRCNAMPDGSYRCSRFRLFLYARLSTALLPNCQQGRHGSQRHRAYFSHRLELRTLPRILS